MDVVGHNRNLMVSVVKERASAISNTATGAGDHTIYHREAGYRRDVGQVGTVRDSMISSPKCNQIGSNLGVVLSVYSILLRKLRKGQGAFML